MPVSQLGGKKQIWFTPVFLTVQCLPHSHDHHSLMVKSKDSGATETWVEKPALPLSSSVALGITVNLSDINLHVYKTREEMIIDNALHSI